MSEVKILGDGNQEIKSKKKKGSFFFKTIGQLYSIVSITSLLFIFTFSCFVGVLVYENYQVTFQSTGKQKEERNGNLKNAANAVKEVIKVLAVSVKELEAQCEVIGESFITHEVDPIEERKLLTYYNSFFTYIENSYEMSSYSYRANIYKKPPGKEYYDKIYGIGIFNGAYSFGYGNVNQTTDSVQIDSYSVNFLKDEEGFMEKGSSYNKTLQYSVPLPSDYLENAYYTPYSNWSYFATTSQGQLLPFLGLTSGIEIQSKNYNFTCINWLGIESSQFSSVLEKNLPSDSFSFVVELNLEYLIALSDLKEISQVLNTQTRSFIKAVDSTNSNLALISEYIFSNEVLRESLKNSAEEIFNFQYQGLDVQCMFFSIQGSSLLFLNVKEIVKMYQDSIITTIISSVVSISFFVIVVVLLVLVISLVFSAWGKLNKNMKLIEKMKLDEILGQKNVFTFFELGLVNEHIRLMAEKLKKFKNFLPAHLFLENLESESVTFNNFGNKTPSESSKSSSSSIDSSNFTKTSSEGSHSAIEKFKIGVIKKEILMMVIKFSPFESMQDEFAKIFPVLERHQGHILRFGNTFIEVLFHNRSVQKAISCINGIRHRNSTKDFRFYIAISFAEVGNVGSFERKMYCCEGNIIEKLWQMENAIPSSVDVSIVLDNESHMELALSGEKYESRLINIVEYKEKYQLEANGPIQTKDSVLKIFEIGREIKTKNDEWIYELKERNSFLRWNLFNQSTKLFEDGKLKEARSKMEEYTKTLEENDRLSNFWMSKYQYFIDGTMKN